MLKKRPRIITFVSLFITLLLAGVWPIVAPSVTEAEKTPNTVVRATTSASLGKSVLVDLRAHKVFLNNNGEVVASMDIVSQGPEGSYYETIGGTYTSDYKVPLHFSSFGYVYMPYSVHLFGNYFIHGIPYYPSGERVASTFSGGCVRLEDADAKRLYNFISTSTPITITRGSEYDFIPTKSTTETIFSMEMTRLMVAIVSLETLPQDEEIIDTNGTSITTRLALLPRLIYGNDDTVSTLYSRSLGEKNYVAYMNKRAKTLGLTNTVFTDIQGPATTSLEDYGRFMSHIMTYKSYLIKDFQN